MCPPFLPELKAPAGAGSKGKAKDDPLLTILAAIMEPKISNTELKTETRDPMKEGVELRAQLEEIRGQLTDTNEQLTITKTQLSKRASPPDPSAISTFDIPFDNLPATVPPRISPYGDHWDFIW